METKNYQKFYNWHFIAIQSLLHNIKLGISFKLYYDKKNFSFLHHVENMPEGVFRQLVKTDDLKILVSAARAQHLSVGLFSQPKLASVPKNISKAQLAYGEIPLINTADASQELADLLYICEENSITPAFLLSDECIDLGYQVPKVRYDDIQEYVKTYDIELQKKVAAKLKLAESDNCEISVFSSAKTSKEHYALVFGDLTTGKTPLIRVHSSCFTGDVLHSLHCDCHDQLHLSIQKIHEYGAGVLIYLNQEGRGIGLLNKLRAYNLQRKGMDTVEANKAIGFSDDIRDFSIAAGILKNLKIDRVKILSNNPQKANKLADFGIIIEERLAHQIAMTEDTKKYYHTKNKKMGHLLDLSEL